MRRGRGPPERRNIVPFSSLEGIVSRGHSILICLICTLSRAWELRQLRKLPSRGASMNRLQLFTAASFLLALSAAVAQQAPQTGSSTGPATSSSPVATPGNSSGTAMTPEDAQDDQSM